jgi:serine/threonine protein kinase
MEGHKLYIALRLMNKGSAADVMRYGWPGGMEEEVVKCILRQALKGLKYVSSPSLYPPRPNLVTVISTSMGSFTATSKPPTYSSMTMAQCC